MDRRFLRPLVPVAAFVFLAAAVVGPPHIKVERVTSASAAPTPGAVLLVEGSHHQDTHLPMVTGRAEGMRAGKRVTKPIVLTPTASKERFGVTKQWDAGTSWILVFTVSEPGHSKDFGNVEALVKVDATGEVVGIDYPKQTNARGDKYGRTATPAEIDAALKTLASR